MAEPARWMHGDPRGLGTATEAAIARARTVKGWRVGGLPIVDGDVRIADMRALLMSSMWMFNSLSTKPPTETMVGPTTSTPAILMDKRVEADFSSAERYNWALLACVSTWARLWERHLAMGGTDLPPDQRRFTTIGGDAAIPMLPELPGAEAAAAWVLPALGIVVGAATVCFLAERTVMVIDRQLARQADSARMMASQAASLDILKSHKEAEKVAGKELPLTAAELKLLNDLAALQKKYAEKTGAGGPFPTLFGDTGLGGVSLGVVVVAGILGAILLTR